MGSSVENKTKEIVIVYESAVIDLLNSEFTGLSSYSDKIIRITQQLVILII